METARDTQLTNTTPIQYSKQSAGSRFLKRGLDVSASILGLILLSPVLSIIALTIRRTSPGPVLFRGARMGKDGKIYRILKFRTMYERPESYNGSRITAGDDERITPFGRWLRDSKINELPQLWNVLKGEMSLVGPRPEEPEVATHWPEAARQEILSVRPGITSPASVLYRHEEQLLKSANVMDDYLRKIMPDKQRLDILYVRTSNFFSDLDIIFSTLLSLIPFFNGKTIPENTLYSGAVVNFFRRHISWFMLDTLVTFFAIGIAGAAWRVFTPLNLGWGPGLILAFGFAMIKSLTGALLGVNRIEWSRAPAIHVFDLFPGIIVATIVVLFANYYWPAGWLGIASTGAKSPWGSEALLPTGLFLTAAGLAFMGIVLVRYRQRLVTGLASRWLRIRHKADILGERVLIIGAGDCGQLAGWLLNKSNLSTTFHVIGIVDDDPHKYKMRFDGYTVLGSTRDLATLVEKYNIGVILYAITRIDLAEQKRILDLCCSLPVRVVIIPDLIKILQEHFLPNGQEINHKGTKALRYKSPIGTKSTKGTNSP